MSCKVFIFGSGATAKGILNKIKDKYSILGFLDNNEARWGKQIEGYTVYSPEAITQNEYDMIIIASYPGLNPIRDQLTAMGVEYGKINPDYVETTEKSRIIFLERLGDLFLSKDIQGCVAECGVFQGEFAKEINRVFPTKKLYLFDTFTGFDVRDVEIEQDNQYSESGEGHLNITSEDIVISKLPHPNMCIIRKGYFPETAEGIDKEFCFVNLDFDLYNPTLAGLEYFYPRMVKGGIILVHDYFAEGYRGVKEAVHDFEKKRLLQLNMLPIGDGLSVCIIND